MASATPLTDAPEGYGPISRSLHWLMAFLIAWQFASALLRVYAEDTTIEGFFWSTHFSVGFTIYVLALVRGVWGLINLKRRPKHPRSLLGRAALGGHFALYALMIVVPLLAILRAAGNGRGFSVYGLQLVSAGGVSVPALVEPANALHGLLGWVLLALIVGHIAMALFHGLVLRDGMLDRMAKGRGGRLAQRL